MRSRPDLICKCGHKSFDHADRPFGTPHVPKSGCFSVANDTGSWCNCLEFRLDNLKYLESLYKQKESI